MMRCLTDAELQAFADHEVRADDADDDGRRVHLLTCEACQRRVEEARQTLRALRHAVDDRIEVPAALAARVERAVRAAATPEVRGATTTVLWAAAGGRGQSRGDWDARGARDGWRTRPWGSLRPLAWLSGVAAVVLLVAAIVVVMSSMSRESTLSAAGVLGRSLNTLSQTSGVEILEYDVQLDGAAMQTMAPELTTGRLRVQQVIDHTNPGRYRVVMLDADGAVLKAVAQDPARRLRTGRVRTDDGSFFFRLTTPPDRPEPHVSPMRVQQAYLRAVVSVMQATADSKLTTRVDETGTSYVVQVPPIAVESDQSIWELSEARAVIRGSDFLLTELTARGSLFGQPFGMAFTLVQRDVKAPDQVSRATFEVAPGPDDLVIDGEATDDPLGDVVRAALKELGRARRASAR